MATIRLGRQVGRNGVSRVVAVKELHPQFAHDQDFTAMFRDEMHVAARVAHPNVVPILDLVSGAGQSMLIMEYVHGESVAQLQSLNKGPFPANMAATIIIGVLRGLHAAHETSGENGESLRIIHRDVTPQNVVVGIDGYPRLLDFGVARANGRTQITRAGQIKGKLSYVSPEQLQGLNLDRRVDIYSASVMLWEMLVGRRLFSARDRQLLEHMILHKPVAAPSFLNPAVSTSLDEIVMRGLSRNPVERFPSAEALAVAVEELGIHVPAIELGAWVRRTWGQGEQLRARLVRDIESAEGDPPSNTVFQGSGGVRTALVESPQSLAGTPVAEVKSTDGNVTVSFRRSRPPILDDDEDLAAPPSAREDAGLLRAPGGPSRGRERALSRRARWLGLAGAVSTVAMTVVVALWSGIHHRGPVLRAAGGLGGDGPIGGIAAMPVQPLLTLLGPRVSGHPGTEAEGGPLVLRHGSSLGVLEVSLPRRSKRDRASGTLAVGRVGASRRANHGAQDAGASHRPTSRDASCAPPYVFDAAGIKHFKPECL